MIERVISGGQVGADIAGLRAAQRAGIPTGGYAPKGFKTLRGPNPDLASLYGLEECQSGYAYRTDLNVAKSDGTMRFAYNWNSPGELCTLKALLKHDKPRFDVPVGREGDRLWIEEGSEPFWARAWIAERDIKVLNVAGNALTALEPLVEEYLQWILA